MPQVNRELSAGRKNAGELTGSTLTWDDVDEIRYRYAQGGVTMASLAREFGVTKQNVHCVVRMKTWKLEHRPSCGDCSRWLNREGLCPVCSIIRGE